MKKIIKHIRIGLLAAIAVFAVSISNAQALTRLTPNHLYQWAKYGDLNRLEQYKRYINLMDKDRNTALCIAQQHEDPDAYTLLLKFGASTKVECHDDNDPICAVIAGEKLRINPAAWLLLGAGAAAGIYALLDDDGGKKGPMCYPGAGSYFTADDCTKNNPGYTCVQSGYCYVKGVCDVTQGNYTGQAECMNAYRGYTCVLDTNKCYIKGVCDVTQGNYTGQTECMNAYRGYTCTLDTNDCYIKGVCDVTQGYYTGQTECMNAYRGYTCTLDTNDCYIKGVCDVTQGYYTTSPECQTANVGHICTLDPNECYMKGACDTANGYYDDITSCEQNNRGYSCTRDTASQCWIKNTPLTCPPEYPAKSIADCGNGSHPDGWRFIPAEGVYAGEEQCGTCQPNVCEIGATRYKDYTRECPSYPGLEKVQVTGLGTFAGDEECYLCGYRCLYVDQAACKIANPGAECNLTPVTVPSDVSSKTSYDCPVPGNVKTECTTGDVKNADKDSCDPKTGLKVTGSTSTSEETSSGTCYICSYACDEVNYFANEATCESRNAGYNCTPQTITPPAKDSGNASVITCYVKGGESGCPGDEVFDCSAKTHPDGWTFVPSGSTSGGKQCGTCQPKPCTKGKTDYKNYDANCPSFNGLDKKNITGLGTFAGDEECFLCGYGCTYANQQACKTANPGAECNSVSVTVPSDISEQTSYNCPIPGDIKTECSIGDTKNVNKTACDPESGLTADSVSPTTEVTATGTCYTCHYVCDEQTYFASENTCKNNNPGYNCTPQTITPPAKDSNNQGNVTCYVKGGESGCPGSEVFDCSAKQHEDGWTFVPSGSMSGGKQCGTCQPKTCTRGATRYKDYDANCPPYTGLEKVQITGLGIFAGDEECFLCGYRCLYTDQAACKRVNPGAACNLTPINVPSDVSSTTSYNCPIPGTVKTECTTGDVKNANQGSCDSQTGLKVTGNTPTSEETSSGPCYTCSYACDEVNYFAQEATCKSKNAGYNCTPQTITPPAKDSGNAGAITCYVKGGASGCPGSEVLDCSAKQHPDGWDFVPSGNMSGDKQCGTCRAKTCTKGKTDYKNYDANCPPFDGLDKKNITGLGIYAGDEECFLCGYGCTYTNQQACKTANPGAECNTTTINVSSQYSETTSYSCPVPGNVRTTCTRGATKNSNKDSCTGVSGLKVTGSNSTNEETSSGPCYICTYACDEVNYFAQESDCKSKNAGYDCKTTQLTPHATDSGNAAQITCYTKGSASGCPGNEVLDCSAKQHPDGWDFVPSGNMSGDKQCGTCRAKTCTKGKTDYKNYDANCPPFDGLDKKNITGLGIYAGDEECFLCGYGCTYTNQQACKTANPGAECNTTTINVSSQYSETTSYSCPVPGNVRTTCTRGATKNSDKNRCDKTTGLTATSVSSTNEETSSGTCHICTYGCDSSAGYYSSSDTCESNNRGYDCTPTQLTPPATDSGNAAKITCYIKGDASGCTGGQVTQSQCSGAGYTWSAGSGYNGSEQCGTCTEKRCPGTQVIESECDTSKGGYTWSGTSNYAGENQCGTCSKNNCSIGSTAYVSPYTDTCPGVNNVEAYGNTPTGVYSGSEQCYYCLYRCLYSNAISCQLATNYICKQDTVSIPSSYSNQGSVSNCYVPTSTVATTMEAKEQQVMKISSGTSDVYGLKGDEQTLINQVNPETGTGGNIQILHNSTGSAYGMYGENGNNMINSTGANITIYNNAGGTAYGMYATQGGKVENDGNIVIKGTNGTAIGIYGEGGNNITNRGLIDVSGYDAYGIYVKDGRGTTVLNEGTINVNAENEAHGIYISENADDTTTVKNRGTITINGDVKEGQSGITLNGASLRNYSIMNLNGNADLNALGGNVYLEKGGQINAESLKGDLNIGTSNVLGGNKNVYTAKNAVNTENADDLDIKSESALFDAVMKRSADRSGYDIEMMRNSFVGFTPNSSIANYLEQNYEQGYLEDMYDEQKLESTASGLSAKIAQDLGYDIMPNFADENFATLKSLSRNISETILKETDEENRVVAGYDNLSWETDSKGVLSGSDLSANSMYTFGDKRLDNNNRLGLGLSYTKLSSNYDRGGDRDLNIISLFVPYLHKFTDNLRLASVLTLGYGTGEYKRAGGNESDISDIFYGLTNELRYSVDLNGFAALEPALMLNAIGYSEDGFDENGINALESKKTHNMSVEVGAGLYLRKDIKMEKYGKIGFKVGGAYYRELGTPYDNIEARLKRGNRMWYKVDDYANLYAHDRAILEAMIDYEYKSIAVYLKYNKLIQKNNPELFDLGIKYNF